MTPLGCLTVAVVLLLSAGCSAVDTQSTRPTDDRIDIVTLRVDPSSPGRLAATEGVLVVEGPCVALESPNGESSMLIWPVPATTWDEAGQTIRVRSAEARLGDWVQLTGSFVTPPTDPAQYGTPPNPACIRELAFLVTAIDSARST
jgi:hypothetical protein